MKNFLRAGLFLLITFSGAYAQERYVMPVDEAKLDASFLAFRTKLIAAVERKDAAYVLSIIDPKIEFSFGGYSGIARFRKEWNLEDKNSRFWKLFLIVIKNGGAFTGEGRTRLNWFSAPYVFTSWPENLGDAYEYHAIMGSNVNLRSAPNTNSDIVSTLSYNVVKVDEERSTKIQTGPTEDHFDYDWYYVETLGGKKGFVKGEFVWSGFDHRAGFQKKRGVWKLIFFIAGD
jgi:hypothetical protein